MLEDDANCDKQQCGKKGVWPFDVGVRKENATPLFSEPKKQTKVKKSKEKVIHPRLGVFVKKGPHFPQRAAMNGVPSPLIFWFSCPIVSR